MTLSGAMRTPGPGRAALGGVCDTMGVSGARPHRPRPSPARYLVLAAAPAALMAAQQLRDGQRGCVRLVRSGGQAHVGWTAGAADGRCGTLVFARRGRSGRR